MSKLIFKVGAIVFSLAFILISNPEFVQACDPISLTPQQQFEGADAVFVGRVSSVTTSSEGDTNLVKGLVEVDKYWKGNLDRNVRITSSGVYTCAPGFNVQANGGYYLIYANRNAQSGDYYISMLGMKLVSNATNEIAALGIGKEITILTDSSKFNRDLSVGVSGSDVSALQSWLIENGYDIPAISSGAAMRGYFGSQTRSAVIRYQAANRIPNTGFVGPLTRGRLNERRSVDSRAPIINGLDAPTSLNVNQTGTWIVRATDPQNGTLSYSVDWGDVATASVICPSGYSCLPSGSPVSIQQGSTFTHSYSNPGTYTVRFTVKNSIGLSIQTSATVVVGNNSVGSLRVISPNGGETWQKGTTQNITWTAPAYFRATNANIKLVEYQYCPDNAMCKLRPALTYSIATNININQNSYSWRVGDAYPVSSTGEGLVGCGLPSNPCVRDGQYTIQICESGTNNCDSSNKEFTIFTDDKPKVLSPNGGESWLSNSVQAIRWDTSKLAANTKLDLYLDQADIYCITAPCGSTHILDKDIAVTTIYNWIVATDIANVRIPDGSYRVRMCLAGSTSNCDSSDNAFTITNSQPASLKINPDTLPDASTNVYYSQVLNAQGFSTSTLKWEVVSGSLPPGFYLQKDALACLPVYPSNCGDTSALTMFRAVIGGMPTKEGTYNFTIKSYNDSQSTTKSYSITIKPGFAIKLNKSSYSQNESIMMTLVAHNQTSTPKTFSFQTSCQIVYRINNSNGSNFFDSTNNNACQSTPTSIVIPAFGTYTWSATHNPETYRLPIGTYKITGWVIGQSRFDSDLFTVTQ